MSPKVDREIEKYVPKPQGGNVDFLREDIAAEGCQRPITIWRGTIIDGHHRMAICAELGIDPPIVDVSGKFDDLGAVKHWMYANANAGRQLTCDQSAAWAARDGYEPPQHVRVSRSWSRARQLIASGAPKATIDQVIAEPSYTLAMALNDTRRAAEKTRARTRAAAKTPEVTDPSPLRSAKGTATRTGLALQRGVRDTLRPIIEAYLAHGHSAADVIALVTDVVEDLTRG